MSRSSELTELLEPVVSGMGYELVGIEYQANPKNALVRIYLDSPNGVTLDDCEKVSRQVSGVLDVEDPISGQYTLEVSSPGLDRPIFKASDYDRFAGEKVKIRVHGSLEGRRRFAGVLRGLNGDCVVVEENGVEISLPLSQIDKANLELEV
ncbi:ribosome maturation factor RimP [Alkalilimnicola ehrlichii]|uniref:Ribosome maturation factor RimP n=1 Tax=Alkalilimnicola ehrlichii TaxID=351052 RepID=A0A3E0X126_9GAMM|nr:ribosome maturation factor RimP [Alkalilimnicola ehrlichii]RFA30581.1 ribosome maturation factor RimP [Alkalilimnicola ehrlichii]RFA38131.1 ribosome maturation factor RimP [Alkalilimnicola ehrlichii]